jgi:sarcosine oxidase subunit beta
MFSQRGVMMLAHNVHDVQSFQRHIHANRLNGVDNRWLTPKEAKDFCPPLNIAKDARYPVMGAALQQRAGTARHDAVAWGYARSAAARGVDIIQNCPVTRHPPRPGRRGRASRPPRASSRPRRSRSRRRPHLGADGSAGVRMPLESYPLQALVSEPVKPVFPCVVMSNTVHAYISQSDKGELVIGSGTDQYVSYSQRGGLPLIEHTLAAICEVFPIFTRMRMLRKWGGIVDVTPDRSCILGKTPVKGLYVNCGWGTGGFKATPGAAHTLAWTVAKDEPHPINAPFTLERFTTGRLIDEAAAAADTPPPPRGADTLRKPLQSARPGEGRAPPGAKVGLHASLSESRLMPEPRHAADPLPLLRRDPAGAGIRLCRRGPYRAARQPRRGHRRGMAGLPVHPLERPRRPFRALAPCPWLRRFFNAARDTVSDRFLTTYKAGEPRPDLAALTPRRASE